MKNSKIKRKIGNPLYGCIACDLETGNPTIYIVLYILTLSLASAMEVVVVAWKLVLSTH